MRVACLIAALLIAGPACAQSIGISLLGLDAQRSAGGGGPPLDTLPAAMAAYSFRRLATGAAGPAVKLSRNSDANTLDVGFTVNGDPDVAAMNTFCAATVCHVATWYDQTVNARHIIGNASVSFQPTINFTCGLGTAGAPCAVMTSAINMNGPSVTPATGVASIAVVHQRSAGTGICIILAQNGSANNRVQTRTGAVGNTLTSASGAINTTATDVQWRSIIGVINGASSGLSIDGTTTTGTVTGNTNANVLYMTGASTTTCSHTELLVWDNVALSAGQIAALTANQRAYWGF